MSLRTIHILRNQKFGDFDLPPVIIRNHRLTSPAPHHYVIFWRFKISSMNFLIFFSKINWEQYAHQNLINVRKNGFNNKFHLGGYENTPKNFCACGADFFFINLRSKISFIIFLVWESVKEEKFTVRILHNLKKVGAMHNLLSEINLKI